MRDRYWWIFFITSQVVILAWASLTLDWERQMSDLWWIPLAVFGYGLFCLWIGYGIGVKKKND